MLKRQIDLFIWSYHIRLNGNLIFLFIIKQIILRHWVLHWLERLIFSVKLCLAVSVGTNYTTDDTYIAFYKKIDHNFYSFNENYDWFLTPCFISAFLIAYGVQYNVFCGKRKYIIHE